ncbi:MAG: hypothetical protein ACE14L_15595 [Terriglobales bacterium]
MLIYLSGAIEYAPDKGKAWRAALTPLLHDLGHQVYDPAEDERKNLDDTEIREFRTWKGTDLARFRRTLRKIIAWDLDWIEHKCDCVIAYWDDHAQRGAGSSAELTLAHRRGIPVYLVTGVPVEQVSGWVLGCATEVFTGFEQLRDFLAQNAGAYQGMAAQVAVPQPPSGGIR